ncbi:MAG: S1 RNA-binding domain-containing protein [Thermoproteota archaeon]|nr:S1 RNA-binding domain-containing protein [Thermoproteota archaeon]
MVGYGSYLTLDEYNNMTGFVHISEIATGWIRNIERHVRPKQKVVLKVIRINNARGEVDTSLKQVSSKERRLKIIEAKKNDKSAAFLDFIKSKLKLIQEKTEDLEDKLLEKYLFAYDAVEVPVRNGIDAINSVSPSKQAKDVTLEASKMISVPRVE